MQLGWAAWQHGGLFIEGEFHAVYDPGNSRPWIDPTPRSPQFPEILFLPDRQATYDLDSTDLVNNRRVSLLPDLRIERALEALSRKTDIMNSVPGVDVAIPAPLVMKMAICEQQAAQLLDDVLRSHRTGDFSMAGAGRNDRCPCGSGKKYKACHGR